MWAIGVLCLLAVTDVLAAPRYNRDMSIATPSYYKREIAPRLYQRDISAFQKRQASDQQKLAPDKSEGPQEPFVNCNGAQPDKEVNIGKDKEEPEKIDNHKFEEKENEKEEDNKGKDEDEKDNNTEKDTDKTGEENPEENPEKPVEVVLEIAKPSSFVSGLFSWPPSFSWPSFQLPTISWPPFLGGRGRVPNYYTHNTYYPGYSNYRYVRVIYW